MKVNRSPLVVKGLTPVKIAASVVDSETPEFEISNNTVPGGTRLSGNPGIVTWLILCSQLARISELGFFVLLHIPFWLGCWPDLFR